MGGGRCVTLVWHCGLSQGGHLFKCVFLFEEKSYLVSSLQCLNLKHKKTWVSRMWLHLTGQNKTKNKTNGILQNVHAAIIYVQCTVHESSIEPPIHPFKAGGLHKDLWLAQILLKPKTSHCYNGSEDLMGALNKPFIKYMDCNRPNDGQSLCPVNSSITELKGLMLLMVNGTYKCCCSTYPWGLLECTAGVDNWKFNQINQNKLMIY